MSQETVLEPPEQGVADPKRYRRTSLPAPHPDEREYRRNFLLGLLTSPRRLWNYALFRAAGRSARVRHLPVKLDVENVSRCNFHCVMCQVSDWSGKKRAEDMTYDDFVRLLDSQYGVYELKLQGMGEPLLGREDYFRMIAYARSKRIWVRTTTNASLLHFQDNYKRLIDSGVNDVQISFDGATKSTFERIRRGSKFELVVENCKRINGYCAERGLVRTRMWVVVQSHNVGEFFEFVDLAAEMQFKRLTFSLSLNGWGQERWEATNQAANAEERVTPAMAREAIERGRRLGVEVTFWNTTDKYDSASQATMCPWPFERAYVSSDMRIVPCCMIANPQVADLGDARRFSQAWKGPDYEEFRRAHLEGKVPRYCQGCYVHASWAPSGRP